MGVIAEYEFQDNIDLRAQDAIVKIGCIAKQLKYQGKVAMTVVARHTSADNPLCIEEADMSVEINTNVSDVDTISQEFQSCNESLAGISTINPRVLYRHGNTFVFQVDFDQPPGSTGDSIRFLVWAPDDEGRHLCAALLENAYSLWSSLSVKPTLN